MKVAELDIAYMAGSMEADGCFHVGNSACLRLTNKGIALLQWAESTFGGTVRSKGTPANCWEWNLAGTLAVNLVVRMLPHLKIKKQEAQLWLEFAGTVGVRGKPISKSVRANRAKLKADITKARKVRNGESS